MQIPGYSFHHYCFGDRTAGVGMYAAERFDVELVPGFQSVTNGFNMDCLCQKIKDGPTTFIIANLYRSRTRCTVQQFLCDLDTPLDALTLTGLPFYILGDMNINLLDHQNPDVIRYSNLCRTFDVLQVIQDPTHVSDTYMTLIDHMLTNNDQALLLARSIDVDIADHHMILGFINHTESEEISKERGFHRDFTNYNSEDFLLSLAWAPFHRIYDHQDVNDKCDCFMDIFINVLDNHAPVKLKSARHHSARAFYHRDLILKSCVCIKNMHRRAFKITGNPNAYSEYSKFRKLARKRYREVFFEQQKAAIQSARNHRAMWNVLKSHCGIIKQTVCPEISPEAANDYCASVGTNIARIAQLRRKPGTSFLTYLERTECNPNDFQAKDINLEDVYYAIKSLNNKAPGSNECTKNALVNSLPITVDFIQDIYQASLTQGIFPISWKHSRLKPLFKRGDKRNVEDYRAISLLTLISKGLEKLVLDQSYQFMQDNNRFSQL